MASHPKGRLEQVRQRQPARSLALFWSLFTLAAEKAGDAVVNEAKKQGERLIEEAEEKGNALIEKAKEGNN